MTNLDQRFEDVLVAIRRVIRAIDLHSHGLIQKYGLTVPQLLILREIMKKGTPTAGDIANSVNLSQATVTNIVTRLEKRGLVMRRRSEEDKRRVHVSATDTAVQLLDEAPSLLHDRFITRFQQLKEWEQLQMLSSLQRLAELMDADELDAAPLLSPGMVVEPFTSEQS